MFELIKVSFLMDLIDDSRPTLEDTCMPTKPCRPTGDCIPDDVSCFPEEIPCEPDLICTPTILP